MMEMDWMKIAIGIVVAVLGYFLRETMQDLKSVKQQSHQNKANIDLLKLEYSGKFETLTEKVGELKETLSDLIKEIKSLNQTINRG